MRVHNAGARARFLLVLVLLAGTVLSGVQPLGTSIGSAPGVAARKANDKGKDHGSAHQGQQNKKGNHRGKKAPASLNAGRISARNADTVEDLECGDLTALRVDGRVYCTHGEDPPLPEPAASDESEVAVESAARSSSRVLCLDDGVSGPRVQIVYVRPSNRDDRYEELLPKFRRLAAEMDLIFDQSARKTGESRRVRYVTDDNCRVDIPELEVSGRATDGFGSLIQKMADAGYDRLDRKYLMLVDDNVFCGVGSFFGGDKRTTDAHDFTGYARVDVPCWDAGSMAHELSHTLGAVQYSAPHTSRGAHCVDEWDVMCYSDEPFEPKMRFLCKDGGQDFRLDCNNDDYYAAKPKPGSYLTKHWNSANSIYLTDGPEITCVDAAFEPDDAYWYAFWDVPMREFDIGETETHAFCEQEGDTDWVLFEATASQTYLIETSDLASGVDTRLVLYRGFREQGWNGMDEVASNDDRDDNDPASAITFTAPSDGSYLVGIAEASGDAGQNDTYDLTIRETANPLAATMTLSPNRAHRGAQFEVVVSGFKKDEKVNIWLQRGGHTTLLGDTEANNDGIAEDEFDLPGNVQPHAYQVEALGSEGSAASASMKVVEKQSDKHEKARKHKRRR